MVDTKSHGQSVGTRGCFIAPVPALVFKLGMGR